MRSLVLGAVLVAALTAPASAQFKMPRVKLKSPVGGAGASDVKTGKVGFGEALIEINEAHMAQFLKGLVAEEAAAARLEAEQKNGAPERNRAREEAYQKQYDDYQKASDKWDKCAEPLQQQGEQEMEQFRAGAAPDPAAMQKLADRMRAAQAAGNLTEVRRLADSVAKASSATTSQGMATAGAADKRITDKCGVKPQEPARPDMEPEMSGEDVTRAGLDASGMTAAQFALFRERVLPFVASKGNSSGGIVLTEDEVAVLKAHQADLAPHLELMQRY